MDTEFTPERVEEAVNLFYQENPPACVNEIQIWLNQAQQSPNAWDFIWLFLQPGKSAELQFYGACTMLHKIRALGYMEDIAHKEITKVMRMILDKVFDLSVTSRAVVSKLCSTVAHLLVYMTPLHLKRPASVLIDHVGSSCSKDLPTFERLLEILELMPEKFEHTETPMRKGSLRLELQADVSKLMDLIKMVSMPGGPFVLSGAAICCCSKWLPFFCDDKHTPFIITLGFGSLQQESTAATAATLLWQVLSSPKLFCDETMVWLTFSTMSKMGDRVKEILELRHEVFIHSMSRVFLAVATSKRNNIVTWLDLESERREVTLNYLKIIERLTFPLGCPPVDSETSRISLQFWEAFFVCSRQGNCSIEELIIDVVTNVMQRMQYPVGNDFSSWSEDVQDDFRAFRQNAHSLLRYLHGHLREPFVVFLQSNIEEGMSEWNQQGLGYCHWPMMEVSLYILAVTAREVMAKHSEFVNKLLQWICSLNPNQSKTVFSTALFAAGSFCEAAKGSPLVGDLIEMVVTGLQCRKTGSSAVMALQGVIEHLSPYISDHLERIFVTSMGVLCLRDLADQDNFRLIECYGQAVSLLPVNAVMAALNLVLRMPLLCLRVQSTHMVPSANIVYALNLLAHLCSTLKPVATESRQSAGHPPGLSQVQSAPEMVTSEQPDSSMDFEVVDSTRTVRAEQSEPVVLNPVEQIFDQVCPCLAPLVIRYADNEEVVEALCKMMKILLPALKENGSRTIARKIVGLCLHLFTKPLFPVVLDLIIDVVLLFKAIDRLHTDLRALLIHVSRQTRGTMASGELEHPELLAAYYTLSAAVIKSAKHLLPCCPSDMVDLLLGAVSVLPKADLRLSDAAFSLVIVIMKAGREDGRARASVVPVLDKVVRGIIQVIGHGAIPEILEKMSDILDAVLLFDRARGLQLLNSSVFDGVMPSHVSESDKKVFVSSCVAGRHARHREVVRFSRLCVFKPEALAVNTSQVDTELSDLLDDFAITPRAEDEDDSHSDTVPCDLFGNV